MKSDYVYVFDEKKLFPFNIYNCLRCGSTIAESSLQEHIMMYHPKVWEKKIKRYKKGGVLNDCRS